MNFFLADPSQLVSSLDDSILARQYIATALLQRDDRQQLAEQTLTFGTANTDWLYRSCAPGHLTASALVVDIHRQKILLIHHKKIGLWLQPGGHADGDGNLAAVAVKEVAEETGLTDVEVILPAFDIDIHKIAERGSEPEHLHFDIRFVLRVSHEQKVQPNEETNGAAWVLPSDQRLTEGGIVRQASQALHIASASLQ